LISILQEERKLLGKRLEGIDSALAALNGMISVKDAKPKRKHGPMSEETKAKLRRAAKARWAKIKR